MTHAVPHTPSARALLALLLPLLALPTPAALAVPPPSALEVGLDIVDTQILPGYAALAAATRRFEAVTAAGCVDRAALEAGFQDVADAWMDVEHWRFGPVEYLDRRQRLWFWPDKHARSARQLDALLGAADPGVLDPERFAQNSAALQGMPAAERLIYDDDALGGYHCDYLRAIAANLVRMATGIVEDWERPDEGERALIAAIAQGNSLLYQSPDEFTAQLLQSLNTELIAMRDQKFDRPLGDALDSARPRRAEFWRSARALPNLRHNLAALARLYGVDAPGMGVLNQDAALDAQLKADFRAAAAALDAITPPFAEAVADPARRPQVEAARAALNTLAERVAKELPGAMGLALGFNSLDGD